MTNKNVNWIVILALVFSLVGAGAGLLGYVASTTPAEQAVPWEVPAEGEDVEARSYGCNVYTEQGCAKYVVASGGEIEIQSGGTLDVQPGATANLNAGLSTTGTLTANALVVTTTSNLQGSISDSGGVLTVADNALVDGAADVIQLTVQGYTTQTSSLFVVEQSDGTDVWNTNNSGQTSSANGAVSFADDVIVDGAADTDQLTVQGYTTQTSELQVWEQYDGTDVALMSNAGALDLNSTIVYGTDNLYPLGYASASIQIECGTTTFTDTTTVTASALTTVTYALVTQATDPVSTASIMTIDAPSTNTFVVSSWESDFTAGTTPVALYWCAVGNQ